MNAKPVLAEEFRLCWDEEESAYVLLFPEGMIILNEEDSAVLQQCSGTKTVADIIREMESADPQLDINHQVQEPLVHAAKNGWVVFV